MGCVNMKMSAGYTEDDPGIEVLHWKADSKVQPCCVKRLRIVVCVWGVSTNLERERERERERGHKVDRYN